MVKYILSLAILLCCCFGLNVHTATYDQEWIRYCENQCKRKVWTGKMVTNTVCECVSQLKDQKIGDYCQSYRHCKGGTLVGKGVACCEKTCIQKLKDYVGIYFCPKDCRGKLGAAKGTCG